MSKTKPDRPAQAQMATIKVPTQLTSECNKHGISSLTDQVKKVGIGGIAYRNIFAFLVLPVAPQSIEKAKQAIRTLRKLKSDPPPDLDPHLIYAIRELERVFQEEL